MQRDLKPALIETLENLRTLSARELDFKLTDIIDDLLSERVTITQEIGEDDNTSPVPEYDRLTDGDYSEFLARNNCD